jgi:hypothetical protein
MKYIVVRLKKDVRVIFEDEFFDGNEFRTQNLLIRVLNLLLDDKDFDVTLHCRPEYNKESN